MKADLNGHLQDYLQDLREVIAENNEAVAREISLLRETLGESLGKLIEAQSGRIPENYIPLETYKEHIETYKDTYKFFLRLSAVVMCVIFGITKLGPDLVRYLLH